MGQTSYSLNAPAALPGLLGDGFNPQKIISKKAEGAIEFGYAVSRGTNADNQVVPGGTDLIGIAVRDLFREENASGDVRYEDEDIVAVAQEGPIWVTIANTGVPGNTLFSTDATGAISVGTAGAGQTQLTGWVLQTTVASAGDLGLIEKV